MAEPTPEGDKSDHPTSKGKLFVERLNAYRNIILAVAALATAVGSWFKPTDTTATKNSFDWSAKKIEELSANDLRTKEDIVALRNYLEGYVQAQRGSTTVPTAVAAGTTEGGIGLGSVGTIGHGAGSGSGSGFGSGAGSVATPARPSRPRRPRPPAPAAGTSPAGLVASDVAPVAAAMVEDRPVALDSAQEPLPLPELRSNPMAIKRPKFEQIADPKN
jgi:hypothetical protein